MLNALSLALPFPPSLNRIWRTRVGHNGKPQVYLDRRYETWKRHCDNLCMATGWHKKPLHGAFTVIITLDSRHRRGDADNRVKAPLDWLQRAGIIDNDRKADSCTVRWGYAPEGCRIELFAAQERAAA